MKASWLIVPEWENAKKSAEIAEKYGAAFEYDDFYDPAVYSDPQEMEKRIQFYLGLARDRSMDTLHGCFLDMAPNSTDSVIREYCMKLMVLSMDTAARLGCRGVVFHTGIISELKMDNYKEGWLNTMEAIYRKLCGAYPALCIYLENTTEQEPELLVRMAERMRDVPNFKLCLDYAHAWITTTPVEEWVRAMAPYLGHMHLNDNDGISDLHKVPGEGAMDYERFARNYEKYIKNVPVLLELSGADNAERALAFMNRVEATEEVVKSTEEGQLQIEQYMSVLETNLAITKEKDKDALLNLILTKSMDIAHCDAGTLYVLREDGLHFKIMKTRSMGIDRGADGSEINLPPVRLSRANVASYAALTGKIVNIPDVYHNDEFDFSGPKKYDSMTGYSTRSMLAVSLVDQDNQVLGVMQFLNVIDRNGELRAFDPGLEKMIEILAAQAAITLQQVNYVNEIHQQIWSFTAALAEEIDRRTPYNGSHTRKVAQYSEDIARHMNRLYEEGKSNEFFSEQRIEQLTMAALLHDIGKMIVPVSVMNKATRLGDHEEPLRQRLKYIALKYRVACLRGAITEAEYEEKCRAIDSALATAEKVNMAGFVNDALLAEMQPYFDLVYRDEEEIIPYFTEEEKKCLTIRKGTLTDEERAVMEGHVIMTEKILEKVHFNKDYKMAPVFAGQHHEYLNGRGYPRHLTAEQIPMESRILTVADIADALLAADRPYKKAFPKEKTIAILRSMVADGSLDGTIVEYLEDVLNTKY